MSATIGSGVASDLAILFRCGAAGAQTDAELVARFVEDRGQPTSEAAFATLVARHGPMVLASCRRVLGRVETADDAFQATFLVLAQKAARLRIEGSLGGWLRGVSVRVALRQRSVGRHATLDGVDVAERVQAAGGLDRSELLAAIDAEIGGLPAHYRSVILECDVRGHSQAKVARKLRCPIGTVQSRLFRARGRLRAALIRRGLAPGAVGLLISTPLDGALAAKTVASLCSRRSATGAMMAPAGVRCLALWWTRRVFMIKLVCIAATLVGLVGVSAGIAASNRTRASDDATPPRKAAAPAPAASFKSRVDALIKELDELHKSVFYEEIEIAFEGTELATEALFLIREGLPGVQRGDPAIVRKAFKERLVRRLDACNRLMSLAEEQPADPAALSAASCVVQQSWIAGYGEKFAAVSGRAIELLLAHHADDPWMVELATSMSRVSLSANRDRLLRGLAASTTLRKTKGTALYLLAGSLEQQVVLSTMARGRRAADGVKPVKAEGVDLDINLKDIWRGASPLDILNCEPEYEAKLSAVDQADLRKEARSLYTRVVEQYSDLPDVFSVLGPGRVWTIGLTLGIESRSRLNALNGLSVGKAAPSMEGTDLVGKVTRLADLKGRVVVLVFWRTGAETARDLEHARTLVDRFQGRPFALFGVCQESPTAVRKALAESPLASTTWQRLAIQSGGNRSAVQLDDYPTAIIIDADGVVRFLGGWTTLLDGLLEGMVKETETARATRPAD